VHGPATRGTRYSDAAKLSENSRGTRMLDHLLLAVKMPFLEITTDGVRKATVWPQVDPLVGDVWRVGMKGLC
jgi:hypothetical protein